MITSRKNPARILFAVVLLTLIAAPVASAGPINPSGNGPGQAARIADRPLTKLLKQRFEVAEGSFQLWSIEDCPVSYAAVGSCYFNNPAAPYVIPVLPYWPDEFVDPATRNAFGETAAGVTAVHRFDPHEAILIAGPLPPEAAYFGIQSYLFSREGTWQSDNATYDFIVNQLGAGSIFFHTLPGNPARIGSFDSLSDSNNNVVIERQSGASWNQVRYFIITPDRYMDKMVRQALRKLGVAEQDTFTEPIPSNMNFGLGPHADDFATFIRYSMPKDGGAPGTPSDMWRHDPTLIVLRIRDPRADRPAWPYPAWNADSPETRTAVDEHGLKGDMDALVEQVSARWDQPCSQAGCQGTALSLVDTQSYPMNLVGPLCDDIGMDCLADSQDASYQFRPGIGFEDGYVYAVVGTLGTKTKNAVYVSLGVNNARLRLGAVNVDGQHLEASTASYSGISNLDKLFVYYFARDCTGPEMEALTGGYCTTIEDSPLKVPYGVKATIVERDYISHGTQRGPDSTRLLPSVVLKLPRP